MSIHIGRVDVATPLDIRYRTVRHESGIAGPQHADSYDLDCRETGASAQANMDKLEKEARRYGCIWLQDDDSLVPSGHYRIEASPTYEKPRGAPRRRPFRVVATRAYRPIVTRQSHDDNVTGADTDDRGADEARKVVYTPTTSEVLVLDPRNVAGAEKVNLPAGAYKAILRVQTKTNVSQKFRCKTTKTDGTVITSGSQVTVGAANNDAWVLVDLGSFTIPDGDHQANWYELHVQGVTAELGDVWLDRVRWVPA